MDIFRPHIKGWIGETKTKLSQKVFLDSKVYHTFNNFIIKDELGSTQIDHVTVSKFGIFVVETKDWTGWIFGSERAAKWTKSIYGNKDTFQNPLRQNYRHTMSLSKYLDISHEKIHSIIMVWGDCEFKTKMPRNVIRGGIRGDTDIIKEFSEVVFTDEEVENICEKLRSGKAEMNLLSGWRHVQSLKQQHNSNDVCPRCGSRLVERSGKQGPFIGCTNFPRCKFTKTLE